MGSKYGTEVMHALCSSDDAECKCECKYQTSIWLRWPQRPGAGWTVYCGDPWVSLGSYILCVPNAQCPVPRCSPFFCMCKAGQSVSPALAVQSAAGFGTRLELQWVVDRGDDAIPGTGQCHWQRTNPHRLAVAQEVAPGILSWPVLVGLMMGRRASWLGS